MISANNKILVSVEYNQKTSINVAGSNFLLAKQFSTNRRESQPVLCTVVEGNDMLQDGTLLLVHHNRFTEGNPHHLGENRYSIAYNDAIFAEIGEGGKVYGMCDNIIVEHIYDEENLLIPDNLRKPNKFKYRVVNAGRKWRSGTNDYRKGDIIFCYEFSDYEIVYVFEGIEHRVIKIKKDDIIGKMRNN